MGVQLCKAFGFPFRLTVADTEQDDDGRNIHPRQRIRVFVSHKMKRIRFHDLRHSDISTTSNIYTYLDFSSKVSSANAIVSIFPENTKV